MEDLSRSKSTDVKKVPNPNYASALAALRPTPPVSGRSTPLNGNASSSSSKPATPANDSFSNLVSFTSAGADKNLSLKEQQKKLLEQKTQNGAGRSSDKLWGGDEQFWNNLGSGRSTPVPPTPTQQNGSAHHNNKPRIALIDDDEVDLFNLTSSTDHRFPTALNPKEPAGSAIVSQVAQQLSSHYQAVQAEEDDDPFGLNELQAKNNTATAQSTAVNDNNDDLLGLLGQPASVKPRSPPAYFTTPSTKTEVHSQDQAVAELVDMGFPAQKARQALDVTESGADVQAAVSWLLNQAHAEAKEKSGARDANKIESLRSSEERSQRRRGGSSLHSGTPWRPDTPKTNAENQEHSGRREDRSSSQAEKDPAQVATELGTTFFKSAGSLWKQGTRKVQQAYQEFNSDSDSSQPRWMREPDHAGTSEMRTQSRTDEAGIGRRRRRASGTQKLTSVTDEAMMLEMGGPPPRKPIRTREESRVDSSADSSRDHSPAVPSRLHQRVTATPAFLQQQLRAPAASSRESLSRQAIEDQASQAYVSSARRRKIASNTNVLVSEPDLLDGAAQISLSPRPAPSVTSQPIRTTTPVSIRPPATKRNIPPVSSISLKASHSHREAGNANFKRGDYSSAHQSYTASLSHLPASHPVTIILLTNRALTALKIGEPKTAIESADKAMAIIGPSKGESEVVDLQNSETARPMRDYYGKALMRKAEALEQTERWNEAAIVWREAVEGGHGGTTSIQGRTRAEKAANPQAARTKPVPVRKPAGMTAPKKSAIFDLSGKTTTTHVNSAAAVDRLRAANAAADRVDDEKFALSDLVDARLTAWKGGKADNLRALLASLDAVLWPEAEWKKISMKDLVLPNKVKIHYMKGIAKVHPDKIPTTATTEHKMIAGAVFSTLNEAWDKFKTENGL